MNKSQWYRLDNVAKIFPAIISKRATTIFRLSVVLKDVVDLELLMRASSNMMQRCPYFNVTLKPGMFWYYFEESPDNHVVYHDSKYPCMNFTPHFGGSKLIRIRPYNKKISIEVSHAITDGAGALKFLKSLTYEYLKLKGINCDKSLDLLYCDEEIDSREFEDSFQNYYKKKLNLKSRGSKSFHFPGKYLHAHQYDVTSCMISVKQIINHCKKEGYSLTEFLTATYIDSFQDFYLSLSKRKQKKLSSIINIRVPVNLRNLFESKSLRNFFLTVNPEIDVKLGRYEFKEIIDIVHHAMGLNLTKKEIQRQISANMRSEVNPLLKVAPLFLKSIALRIAYVSAGDSLTSSSISNLGRVELPTELGSHIDRFEFIPPPTVKNKINCSVISFNDNLCISFGNLSKDKSIERIFVKKITDLGIDINLITTY